MAEICYAGCGLGRPREGKSRQAAAGMSESCQAGSAPREELSLPRGTAERGPARRERGPPVPHGTRRGRVVSDGEVTHGQICTRKPASETQICPSVRAKTPDLELHGVGIRPRGRYRGRHASPAQCSVAHSCTARALSPSLATAGTPATIPWHSPAPEPTTKLPGRGPAACLEPCPGAPPPKLGCWPAPGRWPHGPEDRDSTGLAPARSWDWRERPGGTLRRRWDSGRRCDGDGVSRCRAAWRCGRHWM